MFFEIWDFLYNHHFIIQMSFYFIIVVSFIPKFYKRCKRQALINYNEYNDVRLNYIFNHNNQYQYQHHHSCCSLYKKQQLQSNIKDIVIPSTSSPSSSSSSAAAAAAEAEAAIGATLFSDGYESKQNQQMIILKSRVMNENLTNIDFNTNNSPTVILPCCHDYCHCQHFNIVDNCNNINHHKNNHNHLKQQQQQQQWNNVVEEMKIIHHQNNEIMSEFQGYHKDKNIACNGICLNRHINSDNCNNCQLINNNSKDLNCKLSDEIQLKSVESNGLKSSTSSNKTSSIEINNENHNDDQNKKYVSKSSQVTKMAKMFEKNSNHKHQKLQQQHLNENALNDKRKKITQFPESVVIKRNRFEMNSKFEKFKKNKENYNFENQKCYSMENLAAVNNNIDLKNQYHRSNLKKGFDFGGSNGNIFSKPTYNFSKTNAIITTTTAASIKQQLVKEPLINSKKMKVLSLTSSTTSTSTTSTTSTTTTSSTTTATTTCTNVINTVPNDPNNYNNNNNNLNNSININKSKDNDCNCNSNSNNNNGIDDLNQFIKHSSSIELLSTSPVQTVDEILSQRRFSRPFSQYSISDLLQNSDLKDDDIINANFENIS